MSGTEKTGSLFGRLKSSISRYVEDKSGAVALLFGVTFPVILGAVGLAVDFAQARLVQERLSHALDAAALAAAASGAESDADVQAMVQKFLNMNYPADKLGTTYDLQVKVNGDQISVSAHAFFDTTFLKIIYIDTIDVSVGTTVDREVRGLEVVLVLDNTGSMSYIPSGSTTQNITALRTAAKQFVNILTNNGTNSGGVKIGVVPFANSVRIGRYGLGMNPDGSAYDGDEFVNLPQGVSYTTNHASTTGWYGCIVEHNPDGWDENSTTNDPYPQDVSDDYTGNWDIYQSGHYNTVCTQYQSVCVKYKKNSCTQYQNQCVHEETSWAISDPNNGCPYANVLPLSTDYTDIINTLDSMKAHGSTLSNVGMEWGYKMLSPEAPFTEGADWDSEHWHKAIVLMTDGVNTRSDYYSYYWRGRNNEINKYDDDYDHRLGEVCQQLKDQGVTVYTITFDSGGDVPKDVFRSCATSESYYYHAPTQEELQNVFQSISHQLANLHISS